MARKLIKNKYLDTCENTFPKYTEIVNDKSVKVKRFKIRGRNISFKINAIPPHEEPTAWIKNAVNEVVQHTLENVKPTDKIGITFCGKNFEERGPGWINFRDASSLRFKDIWEMISKIFQSNSEGKCAKLILK